jgi:hypothetical protein
MIAPGLGGAVRKGLGQQSTNNKFGLVGEGALRVIPVLTECCHAPLAFGIEPASLPDITYCRVHVIGRVTAWPTSRSTLPVIIN